MINLFIDVRSHLFFKVWCIYACMCICEERDCLLKMTQENFFRCSWVKKRSKRLIRFFFISTPLLLLSSLKLKMRERCKSARRYKTPVESCYFSSSRHRIFLFIRRCLITINCQNDGRRLLLSLFFFDLHPSNIPNCVNIAVMERLVISSATAALYSCFFLTHWRFLVLSE